MITIAAFLLGIALGWNTRFRSFIRHLERKVRALTGTCKHKGLSGNYVNGDYYYTCHSCSKVKRGVNALWTKE